MRRAGTCTTRASTANWTCSSGATTTRYSSRRDNGDDGLAMRVLFITHGAYFTGAPLSLLTIVRYIKQHRDWDLRILVRKAGPLMDRHEALAPTETFLLPDIPSAPTKEMRAAHYTRLRLEY